MILAQVVLRHNLDQPCFIMLQFDLSHIEFGGPRVEEFEQDMDSHQIPSGSEAQTFGIVLLLARAPENSQRRLICNPAIRKMIQ